MKHLLLAAAAVLSLAVPAIAQETATPPPAPSPGEIVGAAKADEWVPIAPSDLLVMDLATDAKGKSRRVVIQLMPAPFSQGWIGNIRKLAAAHWWDGTSINRVQDNYVTQWGDATEKKALPEGLAMVPESAYHNTGMDLLYHFTGLEKNDQNDARLRADSASYFGKDSRLRPAKPDAYSDRTTIIGGWPMAIDSPLALLEARIWPVHCYGMVGVGRDLSPDTGTGAELYTVNGHAPRHLDRNIALVGRVISGMEHLSSLPRGTGALGFYEDEAERVPITAVRLASEMEADPIPAFEYLSTEGESFAKYADARANRRDPFFNTPAGGADICNIPVPVRVVVRDR